MNFLVKTMMVLASLAGMVGAEVPSLGLSALSPVGGAAESAPQMSVQAAASVSSYRAGEPFLVALRGQTSGTWHAYYKNPGLPGEAPEPTLQAPAGFKVEGPFWGVPELHKAFDSVGFVYTKPLFIWRVTPQEDAPAQADFTLGVTAGLCNEEGCGEPKPYSAALHLAQGDGAADPAWQQEEQRAEVLGDTPVSISATQTPEAVILSFSTPETVESAYFITADNSIDPAAEQKLTKTAAGYSLELKRNDGSNYMASMQNESLKGKLLPELSGLLTFGGKHAVVQHRFEGVPEVAPADTAADEEEEEEEGEEGEEEEDEEEPAEAETPTEPSVSPLPGGSGFSPFAPAAEAAPQMEVQALANVSSYAAGKPFLVALRGQTSGTWHAYYKNPGLPGEAPEPTLQAPAGFKVEGPFWGVPELHKAFDSVGFVYTKPLFIWRVTPQADAAAQADFTLGVTAGLCNEEGCNAPTPYSAALHLTQGDGAANPAWQQEEQRVEGLVYSPVSISDTQTPKAVTLSFSTPETVEKAYFISADNSIDPAAEQKLTKTAAGYSLELKRNDGSNPMASMQDESQQGKPLAKLSGLLTFGDKHAVVEHDFNAPAPAAAPAQPAAPAAAGPDLKGFLIIIGGLFLGGLLLNLMPCVFPVLGLKIMSFVELGGGSRHKVFLHSMAFVAGIMVSFWIISALLIILVPEESRGWALWMQNPWVVYGIVLLLLILGLSMYGVFEIGVGMTSAGQSLQNKSGFTGSFFQGAFVTVVATPCSGPYLGAAMTSALSLPGTWLLVALSFMGLGLAFPYFLMGIFPGLVKYLPQPGEWMESLKQGLSFLLFGAAVWFIDVYLAFWPTDTPLDITKMLISFVVIAAAFWVYGRWCPMYRSTRCRIIGGLVALALLAVGGRYSAPLFTLQEADTAPASTAPAEQVSSAPAAYTVASVSKGQHPVWNAWTPELMQAALKDGHPVFVDFTAKWCATCQANKAIAYTDEVYALFAEHGVVLMKADKTRPNPAIDAELRRLHRNQVPVNVLYLPGKEPAITPVMFTAGVLTDFLLEHLKH
ncbi:MAG: thioredoxin family protein [Akkermansia muciniphila]|nr:thioredoxin family protein [Akkermansia muciniphila]